LPFLTQSIFDDPIGQKAGCSYHFTHHQ